MRALVDVAGGDDLNKRLVGFLHHPLYYGWHVSSNSARNTMVARNADVECNPLSGRRSVWLVSTVRSPLRFLFGEKVKVDFRYTHQKEVESFLTGADSAPCRHKANLWGSGEPRNVDGSSSSSTSFMRVNPSMMRQFVK